MARHRRTRTLRRRIKKSLSRRFRYFPLLKMLVLKPWFRAAFLIATAIALLVALYLPKIWVTTPEGFLPVIRISWLDRTQCWALKRSARQAAAAGNYDRAERAWQMAVAQDPADLEALRGYVENFAHLQRFSARTASLSLGQMGWLLRIARTNREDVVRVARACERFGWYESAADFFRPIPNPLPPEAETVYIKALFHEGRFAEFHERLKRAELQGPAEALNLYRLADRIGSGSPEEAREAKERLAELSRDVLSGREAARIYLVSAGRVGDLSAYEESLKRLESLNGAGVVDHVNHWLLLAAAGRKEEALRLAEAFTTSPGNAREMIRLADGYRRLGMIEASHEVLNHFVPQFSNSAEAWLYYADFLEQNQKWAELRGAAAMIREERSLFTKLWGYSFFLEGLANHRLELGSGAGLAFEKAADFDYESPAIAYRVARELVSLNFPALALKVLKKIESEAPNTLAFWETYFQAAYLAKDAAAVLTAAEHSYHLNPRDADLHNRYAAALILNEKNPDESVKLTFELLTAYPHSAAAAINHAFALLLNRRDQEAREVLEQLAGRELHPAERNYWHLGLFEVYSNLGIWDRAWRESDLVEAGTLFPNQKKEFEKRRSALPERVAQRS